MNFEFKIISLTESWCQSDDDKNNSLLQIPNYSLIHQVRYDKKSVCLYINCLNYKLRNDLSVNVEIINKTSKNIIVHVIYRPPCGKM